MDSNLIFKEIEKLVEINKFDISFRCSNIGLWKKVYNELSFKSVIFSENFLDYQKIYNDYFDDLVVDISFIIYHNKEPVALLPAFFFKKNNIVNYFDSNLFLPIFKDKVYQISRKHIIKSVINFFIKIKNHFKINEINLSNHGPEIKKNNLDFENLNKFYTFNNHHLYLNLQKSSTEIRKNFRKSYLNILNKKIVDKILVFDTRMHSKKIWINFKKLHYTEAKKKTRSDKSWDKQFENLCNNKAIFLFYLHNDNLIAGSLFDISPDEAFYSVGVYNDLAKQKFVSHYIQEAAINEFKTRKIKWYFLGKYFEDYSKNLTKKEYNISFFKKGFSSNIINNQIVQI